MTRRTLLLLGGLSLSARDAVAADDEGAFARLFPRPTGANGYEEITRAGDLARQSKTLSAAAQRGAPLSAKRRALAEAGNVRALALVRRGLAKPVGSPRPATIEPTTLFPEFPGLRTLARLLSIEQHIRLADGQGGAAVDGLRDALRLSGVAKPEMLIGALAGVAMDAIVLGRFVRHLDGLSVRSCNRVIGIVRDHLRAPDLLIVAIENERRFLLANVAAQFKDSAPTGPEEADGEDDVSPALRAEMARVRRDPAAWDAFAARVAGRIHARFDAVIATLRAPARAAAAPDAVPASGRLADDYAGQIITVLAGAPARFTQNRIHWQLLAVHAAVRAFRWETDRLPETLAELNLNGLETDPYTGAPLIYKLTSETIYELASAGPAGGKAPVTLPLSGPGARS